MPHAAERFAERVRPGLSAREASVELARLLREFGVRVERPGWCPPVRRGRFVVEVADGVVAIVQPPPERGLLPQAVTVITRSSMGVESRGKRNARAATRRARRASRRHELSGRPRPARHSGRSNLGEQEA